MSLWEVQYCLLEQRWGLWWMSDELSVFLFVMHDVSKYRTRKILEQKNSISNFAAKAIFGMDCDVRQLRTNFKRNLIGLHRVHRCWWRYWPMWSPSPIIFFSSQSPTTKNRHQRYIGIITISSTSVSPLALDVVWNSADWSNTAKLVREIAFPPVFKHNSVWFYGLPSSRVFMNFRTCVQ